MILENIPSNSVSLTACKSGHDSLKISGNIYQITCFGNRRTVQTVSGTCLTDSHDRRVISIFMSEITNYSTSQRTNTGLNKYVSRTVNSHFF